MVRLLGGKTWSYIRFGESPVILSSFMTLAAFAISSLSRNLPFHLSVTYLSQTLFSVLHPFQVSLLRSVYFLLTYVPGY